MFVKMNYHRVMKSEEIHKAVKKLGRKLTDTYHGKEVVAICVLNGAMWFFVDLTREIDLPILCDSIRVESYASNKQSDDFKIRSCLKLHLEGKHVLIIDDVYDTGQTLEKLKSMFLGMRAASVKTVAFAVKCEKSKPDFHCVDFTKNDYLVGYGLDDCEKFRNLDELGVIHD